MIKLCSGGFTGGDTFWSPYGLEKSRKDVSSSQSNEEEKEADDQLLAHTVT